MNTTVLPMNIVTIEDSHNQYVLQNPCAVVQFPLLKDDLRLIAAMKDKLTELGGVGLAAPQINQSKRIAAVFIPEDAALLRNNVKPYPMHVLINPSYEPQGHPLKVTEFEACYSVLHKAGKVPRYQTIKLTYFDEQGIQHQRMEEGFYARVLQHEIDHLNGILITDRLTPDCVQGSMEEMMLMRRNELTAEQKILFDELMEKKQRKARR